MEEQIASNGKVKKQMGAYTFRVEGYSGLPTTIGTSTESPEFPLVGHTWQLRIFPGGSLDMHKSYVSFYLASKSNRQARASYKLSVLNQRPGGADETFSSSGVRVFEAKGTQIDGWGRDKFMLISTLKDPSLGFYVNDTVIFKVSLTVFGGLETAAFPIVSSRDLTSPDITLNESMFFLLQDSLAAKDNTSTDMVLLAGDEEEPLHCHRCVLKARSPVFNAMLSVPTIPMVPRLTSKGSDLSNSGESRKEDTATAAGAGRSSEPSHVLFPPGLVTHRGHVQKHEYGNEQGLGLASTVSVSTESEGEEDIALEQRPLKRGAGRATNEESKRGEDSFFGVASSPLGVNKRCWDYRVSRARYTEGGRGVVTMPETDVAVAREMLVFLYSDAFSSSTVVETYAVPLLVVAAKYQVARLFTIVEEYLRVQVELSTAVPLLQLANAYDARKLRSACMTFIVENPTEIVKLKEYQALPHLASCLPQGNPLAECFVHGDEGRIGSGSTSPLSVTEQCTGGMTSRALSLDQEAMLCGSTYAPGALGLRETIERALQTSTVYSGNSIFSTADSMGSAGSEAATWRPGGGTADTPGNGAEGSTLSSTLHVTTSLDTTGASAQLDIHGAATQSRRAEEALQEYQRQRRGCAIM